MFRVRYFIAAIVAVAPMMAVAATLAWPAGDATQIGSSSNIGSSFEPSGAVWNSVEEKLYVVSDEGDIVQMNADGTAVEEWSLSGDFEGLAIADHSTSKIYVGIEHPDAIIEFDTEVGALTGKSWDVTSIIQSSSSNQGLEALTYLPNGHHPYTDSNNGGLFYAGLQENGTIYVLDINTALSDEVSLIDTITPVSGQRDISGLHYDQNTERVYAIYDAYNVLLEMQADGSILQKYSLAGNDQEGITFIMNCSTNLAAAIVAEDVGAEVWKYDGYPVSCIEEDEESTEEEIPESIEEEETVSEETIESSEESTEEEQTEEQEIIEEESTEEIGEEESIEEAEEEFVDIEDSVEVTVERLERKKNNVVVVHYSNGDSKTIELFDLGTQKAKVQLHTEGGILIAINKRYIKTFDAFSGAIVDQKRLYKKKQQSVRLLVKNIYKKNTNNNVFVLSKRKGKKKQVHIRSFVIDETGNILKKNTKKVILNKKVKSLKDVSLRKNKKNGKQARLILHYKNKKLVEKKFSLKNAGNLAMVR